MRLALNNHGIYFDVQLAIFVAFSRDMSAIEKIMNGVKTRRIPGQIDRKGRLSRELKRTRPFHYTSFTIQGFLDLASLGGCVDRDLWSFETHKGAGLQKAILFQAGYADKLTIWPYKEIRKIDMKGLFENLCRVRSDSGWKSPVLENAYRHLAGQYQGIRIQLLTNGCTS